jgi:protoporphyrinogen oxidase
MSTKTAVIIGAGPAGLTAAYELCTRSDIKPIVVEASCYAGGIARTVNYKGNRIDLGGHRFFSKSDRVMAWWTKLLPIQGPASGGAETIRLGHQRQQRSLDILPDGPDPELYDDVMLVRPRVSRILFERQFFDYPLKPSLKTISQLGWMRSLKIAGSYANSLLSPVRPECTLEDFFTNHFGRELYTTFFRDYTEKVWGVPCHLIPAEWGAQRIKGVSVANLIRHALLRYSGAASDLTHKTTETSLIEQFLYPKYGPGQLWEKVAALVQARGGEILYKTQVLGLRHALKTVLSVEVRDGAGAITTLRGDWFLSSMPISDLVAGMAPSAPGHVREVAQGLPYRDFITVGVLLTRLHLNGQVTAHELHDRVPDNWSYIQEPDVKVGRLQIFNNWSPYLVADPDTIWIGLEYFVNAGDSLWSMPDDELVQFAVSELERIGVIDRGDVLDHVVIRMPKTYPAYFGTYDRFAEVRDYFDRFSNLYLVGRNGMHRYNNQDHSMLTAMTAVDGILSGMDVRQALWEINTEQDYHESYRKS